MKKLAALFLALTLVTPYLYAEDPIAGTAAAEPAEASDWLTDTSASDSLPHETAVDAPSDATITESAPVAEEVKEEAPAAEKKVEKKAKKNKKKAAVKKKKSAVKKKAVKKVSAKKKKQS